VTPAFRELFGAFYATWQSVEITMEWAIGQFLKISYEDTHLITAGMQFGRKAMLLRALAGRSDRKNKGEIIKCLSFFVEQSKRNVFAHSFAKSNDDLVTFVNRDNHGKFKMTEHAFTPGEFTAHVG